MYLLQKREYYILYKKTISNLYKKKERKESFFEVLIKSHLKENQYNFRKFVQPNYDQLTFILALNKRRYLVLSPSNKIKKTNFT